MQEAKSRENPRISKSNGAHQIDKGREAHSSQPLSHYTARDTIGMVPFLRIIFVVKEQEKFESLNSIVSNLF